MTNDATSNTAPPATDPPPAALDANDVTAAFAQMAEQSNGTIDAGTAGGHVGTTSDAPPSTPDGSSSSDDQGRPGGPSLSDQIRELSDRLDAAGIARREAIHQRADARDQANAYDEEIAKLRREIGDLRARDAATSAGAVNPDTVARLIRDADDPVAAIESLRESDAYLFQQGGTTRTSSTRPAGADMSDPAPTTKSGDAGLDDFAKYVRDTYMS
jgi:hypothetical protein